MRQIKVILANRSSGRFWSIEDIFSTVHKTFPMWVKSTVISAPRGCTNFGSLVSNLLWMHSLKDCDLVHQTGDIHYAILSLWRRPVVLTIHDLRFIEEARGVKRILFRLFWLYFPCAHAKRVTVISKFTKARLLSLCHINEAKVRVISNCVSPEFVAKKNVWTSSKVQLLHVGTTDNKNLARVVEACVGFPVRLLILGKLSGAQHKQLKHHKIEFKEYVGLSKAKVYDLYAACNLVVFVSTYEGFGMPIIEAQAIGRPVLTSDISPMREVAGEGALRVDPFNIASIRAGLERLLEDAHLREQLVVAGFQNVKRFSASAVALQYAALYREVMGEA